MLLYNIALQYHQSVLQIGLLFFIGSVAYMATALPVGPITDKLVSCRSSGTHHNIEYSGTSDKGPSEKWTTSQQRTKWLIPMCPLFGSFTVIRKHVPTLQG